MRKILIANRGEICRRIGETIQNMGLTPVAICLDQTPPLYLANVIDDFIFTERTDVNIYLDKQRLIDLAKKEECDGIHPGFGFLSENSEFAKLCVKEGLTWIGPDPDSMDLMASKTSAREAAVNANVPVNDTLLIDNNTQEKDAIAFANKIGFPVLVKAAFGGGGKGMRRVDEPSTLMEAVERCKSEAKNAFGNESVFIEKYIINPRHIEVQIIADGKKAYTVGDRDCSLQRRHQKVIEEAPAYGLTDSEREYLYSASISLAESVGYKSLGTLEYLYTPDDKKFYFLEMNTRLQVEHPVTEEVFGIDLIKAQIEVAMGKPIQNIPQKPSGHAIEARIYGEDPENGFLPSPGDVYLFEPYYGKGVRWEKGLDRQDTITGEYDPMISKVIATADTRDDAIKALSNTLDKTWVCGPRCNKDFLIDLLNEKIFTQMKTTTGYLDSADSYVNKRRSNIESEVSILSSSVNKIFQASHSGVTQNAFAASNVTSSNSNVIICDAAQLSFNKDTEVTHLKGFINQKYFEFVYVDSFEFTKAWYRDNSKQGDYILEKESIAKYSEGSIDENTLTSPVPGKIIKINNSPGDHVAEGDSVLILESMKMEFSVDAPKDGVISEIFVKLGDQVSAGVELMSWENN